MAYFKAVKNYQIYLIEKSLEKHGMKQGARFLDVGCGKGELCAFLDKKGYTGMGIDSSGEAIAKAHELQLNSVKIIHNDLFHFNGEFDFILMIDVLEHIKDDKAAFRKIYSLLTKNGYLIFQIPSHRRKYSWIDRNYGHLRRYDRRDIEKIILQTNFKILDIWCSGFPFISVMEDMLSHLGALFVSQRNNADTDLDEGTKKSSISSPIKNKFRFTDFIFNDLIGARWLWRPLYSIMDIFLRSDMGSTYFIICQKNEGIK